MPPAVQNIRPVDPLVFAEMDTLIDGSINAPGDFAGAVLFPRHNLGEGQFVQARGAEFTMQRIKANTYRKKPVQRSRRAPGAQIARGTGIQLDPIKGRTFEHSLGEMVEGLTAKRAQGIQLVAATGAKVDADLDIEREERLDVFLQGEWHPDGGDVAQPWYIDDAANPDANPIAAIRFGLLKTRGNTVFFCEEAFERFISHKTVREARPIILDRSILGDEEVAAIFGQKFARLNRGRAIRIVISSAKYVDENDVEMPICGGADPYIWTGRTDPYVSMQGSREFRVRYTAGMHIDEDLPAGAAYNNPTRRDGKLYELGYSQDTRSWLLTVGHAETLIKANRHAGMKLTGLLATT